MGERRFKASCIAVNIFDGSQTHCLIVHYSIDDFDAWDIWGIEVDNSIYIDDIFAGYEMPPQKEGCWVWEGEIKPVYDDQSCYYGKWRPATINDLKILIPKE